MDENRNWQTRWIRFKSVLVLYNHKKMHFLMALQNDALATYCFFFLIMRCFIPRLHIVTYTQKEHLITQLLYETGSRIQPPLMPLGTARPQSLRAFTVSGGLKCRGADQKECSLWERDYALGRARGNAREKALPHEVSRTAGSDVEAAVFAG